jgi:CubicO group peptidase (beta-lactamase class C family)
LLQTPDMKMSSLSHSFVAASVICGLSLLSMSCNPGREARKPVTAHSSVWDQQNINAFEKRLEKLRRHYHIPSLSAGIVNEKMLAWKKGFGYADLANKIVPDENTVYHLASVTKTFSSILLLQLVEQGKVNLNDPVTKYGIHLRGRWNNKPLIKVKHLLTHTGQGRLYNGYLPGLSFRYSGDFYHYIGQVIEKASGQSFGELMMNNIIKPLGLLHTVPNTADSLNFSRTGYNKDSFLTKVAKGYNWQGHKLTRVNYPAYFGASAGLMSSVADLASYSIAMDDHKFLNPSTWEDVFTPFESALGKRFPYGLGWFVKYYFGIKVIWHTGWWHGVSTLLIKIPEKDLTFIILANSQDLSRPFYLTLYPVPLPNPFKPGLQTDLLVSEFAEAFIDYFRVFD